ncbi:MAG: glycosyltransferase family 4 protein [Armatimonadetes bacterium]|nr:glycosyltransferase family 4 protein [Armatimonadota bacterium]
MPKLLLVSHWDWVLYNFRLPLARRLRDQGYEVIFVCPFGEYVEGLRSERFPCIHWQVSRRSLNPLREVGSVRHLIRIYRQEQPDLAHHFTIKPNLYGSIAAQRAKVPRIVNTFSGLGWLFSSSKLSSAIRLGVIPVLRKALHAPGVWTIFQNQEDMKSLLAIRAIPEDRCLIIAGSGVDTSRFSYVVPLSGSNGNPVFLMACRLLKDKGVGEFVEAARLIRKRGGSARFWLAGALDKGNPACIAQESLTAWEQEGIVELLGQRGDMPDLLRQVDAAVLPSYHEGVPRFLLEAASAGLPLVATDIEGCRMVIEEGVNGFRVPIRNAEKLAEALWKLAKDASLRLRMGRASRDIAVRRFDESQILSQFEQLYADLLNR